jgi:hypothetical protein
MEPSPRNSSAMMCFCTRSNRALILLIPRLGMDTVYQRLFSEMDSRRFPVRCDQRRGQQQAVSSWKSGATLRFFVLTQAYYLTTKVCRYGPHALEMFDFTYVAVQCW